MAGAAIGRVARSGAAAALAIALLLGALLPFRTLLPFKEFDQPFYLGIAYDLITTGRFTNGFMFEPPGAVGPRPSGMRFAPLYPALLAVAGQLDPEMRQGMACLVHTRAKDPDCPMAAGLVRNTQLFLLGIVLWLTWWLGWRLTGRLGGAWATLAIAAPAVPMLLASAGMLMTETVTLLFTTAATAATVEAMRGHRPAAWSGAAGVLLAGAALTRPAFLYLIPAMALGVALVRWRRDARAPIGTGTRRRARPAVALAAAAALTLSPWIARNAVLFGRPALSFGYDSHTLVQRIAFDTMTWQEYGLSWICFLPDGNGLGQMAGGRGACDRFGWDERPDTFYSIGLRKMLPETLAAAGGYPHHLWYLLSHYVLRMPLWHAAVTLPLALRGAAIRHWWGFVLTIVALVATWRAWRRQEAGFLALALPAWGMLLFNAAVAVNQPRYNYMLVPVFAVAGARVVERALRGWREKQGGRGRPPWTPAIR